MFSGRRVSMGRQGTDALDHLLILDGRRLLPEQRVAASERGESDVVITSPRLLTRLDTDFNIETPPGEDGAGRARRAQFLLFLVLGRA